MRFTSPLGTAIYPHLNKPDVEFNPDGVYKTDLGMEDARELYAACEKAAIAEFGKDVKFKMPFRQDEESGTTVIRVKSKYAPKIYDSEGYLMLGDQIPNLWGGSTLKVGGYITTYSVSGSKGVSLQLTKVQVIKPVSGSGSDGGFEPVDGGFVAPKNTPEEFDDEETGEIGRAIEKTADRF